MTSPGRCASATVAQFDFADPTTRVLLLIQVIDDVLAALELWQSVGVTDGGWVLSVWSRRVTPRIGIELPHRVRNADEPWRRYEALLAWQHESVESLRTLSSRDSNHSRREHCKSNSERGGE
jgi:hypothetical protein